MKEVKMFKMQQKVTIKGTGKVFFRLSAEKVNNIEYILNLRKTVYDFLPRDVVFSPLITHIEYFPDDYIYKLVDMHSWIKKRIWNTRYIISPRFKELLSGFNLYTHTFYKAEVAFKEKLVPYHVFHLKSNLNFTDWINYDYSIFGNEYDIRKNKSTQPYKVSNEKELIALQKRKGWTQWGFIRKVVQPIFTEYDLIHVTNPYSYLISERLKEAIVNSNLEGIEIEEKPFIFEVR